MSHCPHRPPEYLGRLMFKPYYYCGKRVYRKYVITEYFGFAFCSCSLGKHRRVLYIECREREKFVSDLASVPRILMSFYPPDGDYAEAAVVHDLALSQGYSFWDSARIFALALKAQRIPRFKRTLLSGGVYIAAIWYTLFKSNNTQ